jgi:hypothetical protein
MGKFKDSLGDKPIAEKPANAVSTTGSNPWLDYGEAVGASNIVGDLLKFSKGDFLAGQDSREIAMGTRLIANMDTLEVGWIKWEDNRPAERRMGLFAEGFRAVKRSELGDDDRELWETYDDGSAKDPWQFSNQLIFASPDDGEVFTFATSSRGGLGAIGELCKAYGQGMRQHPDEWPIVKLDVGSYAHRNKNFGRIKFPIFEVVGWAPKDGQEVPVPASPAPAPAAAKASARF